MEDVFAVIVLVMIGELHGARDFCLSRIPKEDRHGTVIVLADAVFGFMLSEHMLAKKGHIVKEKITFVRTRERW